MRTGLFYGSSTGGTAAIAENLKAALGGKITAMENIGNIAPADLQGFDNLIFGTSTWQGEKTEKHLQEDWENFLPKMDTLDLRGKKVAVFGLGDQVTYPDHYQDAVGILADKAVERGATLVGMTSPEGQKFTASRALQDGKMKGLCLDMMNQNDKTEVRVADWVEQIKKEMF